MAGESDTLPAPAEASPELWRAPEEWANTPEFREMMAREFPEQAEVWTDPVTRRQFITLLGASLALAGLNGCSPRPASRRTIVPYSTQPDGLVPGIPLVFATSMTLGGVATGLLVRSNEGRPTKIEGNPSHPGSLGGTDVFAQAAILGLYDPDRSTALTQLGDPQSWADFVSTFRSILENNPGGSVRILTETVGSPTLAAQIGRLAARYPGADVKWVQYEPAGRDNARAGTRQAFGEDRATVYDFTKANVVLALDSEFLTQGPGSVRYARDFISRRRVRQARADGGPAERMNRLYAVEPMLTATGAVADHRLPLRSADVEGFARALAAQLGVPGAPSAGSIPESARAWLKPLADDLNNNRGTSIVVCGDHLPPSVHALVHAINDHLRNAGATVLYTRPVEAKPEDQLAGLRGLVREMNEDKVGVLLILGGNPVFTAPADLHFEKALERVKNSVHLGLYQDETAVLCRWHVPEAHFLECWGDARGYDGTVSIQQPLIKPLYDGASALELVAALAAAPDQVAQSALELIRAHWTANQPAGTGDFDHFWHEALRDGVVAHTSFLDEKAKDKKDGKKSGGLAQGWAGKDAGAPAGAGSGYELCLRLDPHIHDGRFANNGWLQELPKPISKLCWDNAAIMSPKTAQKLGLEQFPRWTAGERGRMEVDYVEITVQGNKVKAPVWIQPGHVDDSITVYLGYGRTLAGKVGNGAGFNAYALRTTAALWGATGVDVKKADGDEYLACTQAHYNMEGRKPVRRVVRDTLGAMAGGGDESKKARREFDTAMEPPVASADKHLIAENVPGPFERAERDRNTHNHLHDHDHDHPHEGPPHDPRVADPKDEFGRRPLTMYPPTNKDGRRWAMAIDLTSCIGCNTCMIACMAENNIPVVGKKEVTRGRELYWIRVDRYHEGDPTVAEGLKTYFQPVPCMQCEKAPCELVCPVGATVHSTDGLNDMVYNRCVGTRYCSNNCPYKVRRFNFFTYADYVTESLKLGRNPDVTVRSRGVMEKCTYCVQRIRQAEIVAEREWDSPDRPKDENGRPLIRDGEVVTACQAACPTGAIMFGDLADTRSVVRRWKAEPTNYGLLAELNTMPRTSYLASVRNPNPDMPKGA
jgi:MoCo/4Fe-4S cofactor protein with predicted Tat translocation signal